MNIAGLHGRRKMICLLGRLQWWNLPIEEIDMLMPILSSPDIAEAKNLGKISSPGRINRRLYKSIL